MNYHDHAWISYKLKQHYDEAKTLIPEERIVGIFLQGSQNYGLDTKDSDVDTKCIIVPSFRDIALARQPMSTTHVRQNEEHIDLKDIRLYIQTFRKQNLNFLEILFTQYCYFPNDDFYYEWIKLRNAREEITHYDPVRSVKSMMGIASEKYFALEHHYPSRMKWIEKFGYDPKQLHHLVRVAEFLKKYIEGVDYIHCLYSQNADYLKSIKEGCLNVEEARKLANETYDDITKMCDNFIMEHSKDKTRYPEVDKLLDDVSCEIMSIAVRNEIRNGNA